MRQKFMSVALACVLCLGMTVPAYAAEQSAEIEAAGVYLRERGVYQGDGSGNLMLDKGLSRAELAVILTRLHGEGQINPDHYTWACYFTDVPEWAKPYVGYCVANLLVAGYDETRYGPGDPVTPAQACTVILRTCGYGRGEGSSWSYRTACDYAVRMGLISQPTAQAQTITRGEMAVLICRALGEQSPAVQPDPIPQVDGVTVGQDGTITSKVITQSDWSREDFSQKANPAIFTGYYTRGWYNALRQSIVDRDTIVAGNNKGNFNPKYLYAHTLVPDQPEEQFDAFSGILGQIYGLHNYESDGEPYTKNQYEFPGYTIVKVYCGQNALTILQFIQPKLNELSGKTDREKVIAFNNYVCDLVDYGDGAGGISDVFSPHDEPVRGICAVYANSFAYLCDAAGIPCIIVTSENHAWNEVYVDDQWLTVDVTFNDASAGRDWYLLTKKAPRTDIHPEGTLFAKELLVPGSTK